MIVSNKVFISIEGNILLYKDLFDNPKIAGSIEYDIEEVRGFSTLYNLEIKKEFRNMGFATKLRTFVIEAIKKSNISKVITNPKSYSTDFLTKDLVSFYKKNFVNLGAVEIKERNLYHGKIELVAIF